MKIKLLVILTLLVAFATKISAQDELRLRMGVKLEKKLAKKLELELLPEIRLESKNQLEETLLETGLNYKLFKFMDVAGQYRIGFVPEYDNAQHRFALDVKPKVSFNDLKLQLRLRYTNYTDFQHDTEDKSTYLRSRLRCKYDFNNFPLTPFVSAELYYRADEEDFNKSRFGTGFSLRLSETSSIGCYYLLRYKHKNEQTAQILGVEFKIEL